MQGVSLKLQREISKISPAFDFKGSIFIISLLFIAVGCASSIPFYKRDAYDKSLYVPFIRQKTDFCGPASLAMILNFWGVDITQDEIAQEIYSPELKGALSIEMVLYAAQKGFEAEMYNGSLQDLKYRIKAGFPLIVSHRLDKGNKRVHYLVAWGFNDDKGVIYVHSDVRESLPMDYQTFLKYWGWAENLTFFIYPKNKVYINTNN
jgi:ABC-type bacteriocin/lantibiotic exporter with double-glycine peptidase domain